MVIGVSVTGREWGGKQAWMLEITADLVRAGHDVEILTEPGGAFLPGAVALGLPCTTIDMAAGDTIAIQRLQRWHLALTTGRIDSVAIAKALSKARLDVPHVAMRLSGFPLDVTDPATVLMLQQVAAFVVASDELRSSEAAQLVRDPARVHVVHTGLRLSSWMKSEGRPLTPESLGIKPHATVVGTVARLSWEKGHRVLLQAFAELASSNPNLHLLLVGEGPERPALEQFAHGLGLVGQVTFAGFRRDVAAILRLLDIFVLPSIAGETGPLALKEAIAMARPVIASRIGGVPEFVTDQVTGLLVEPGDVKGLREALAMLIGDPARARTLARAAREAALVDIDWDRRAGAFVALLERVAVEVGPPAAILSQLRWEDSARVRQEDFGGLVFVPATSQVVQLDPQAYTVVARLPGTPDATALMELAASSPRLIRDLYYAKALRMIRSQSQTRSP